MSRKVLALALLLGLASSVLAAVEDSVSLTRFRAAKLYCSAVRPKTVILLLAGGGWDESASGLARTLASELNALVVGADVQAYIRELNGSVETCANAAADFEELSKVAQKKIKLPDYMSPILVGTRTGSTLAYAVLAEARPSAFEGAISLGFCPDIDLLNPLCRGAGLEMTEGPLGRGYSVLPCPTLEPPWIVLQGRQSTACPIDSVRAFVSRTQSAQIIELPTVKDDFADTKRWLSQFKLAMRTLSYLRPPVTPAFSKKLEDLPLVEAKPRGQGPDALAFYITGDGGYGVTDRGIAEGLAGHGLPVVALNSLKYFWTKRTPDETAKDLERVLRNYLAATKKNELVLIGYSLGADVLPFVINRLPDDLRYKVRLVVLLGPSLTVNFEFHLSDWLASKARPDDRAVLPEIAKLKNVVLFCFYGEKDKSEICHRIKMPNIRIFAIPGGHRFGRAFDPVVRAVLEELEATRAKSSWRRPAG
jgi:type IV secretory pathway VirJ component